MSVCPNNLILISVTISISASWFVGAFDCGRVGLSASWLSGSWFVGELSSYQNINPLGILKQQDVMKVALVITETML